MLLSDLNINECGYIRKINHSGRELRRLYDLGFTYGTKVCLVLISPSKLIKAYLVWDSIIALRNSDASKIEVEYA